MKRYSAILLPGGLVLMVAVVLFHSNLFSSYEHNFLAYASWTVFSFGLLLSSLFHRSRIFFALLLLALADRSLFWLTPQIASVAAGNIVFEAVSVLLPLNLLALAFASERGIVTAWGRWRLAFILLQVPAVALLSLPQFSLLADVLQQEWFPRRFLGWSSLTQPGLLAFAIAGAILFVRLVKQQKPADSGLFWALAASCIALNMGNGKALPSAYFATGGLILSIAVLETSYSMAYRDELTGLPGRRSFNEALLQLDDAYAIGMVDVDHFKQFNDNYGHDAGDHVLRMVASKLSAVTGGGRAFRYGGEEFAILFPNLSVKQALPHLESLRQQIEKFDFNVRSQDRRLRADSNGRPAYKARAADRRFVPAGERVSVRRSGKRTAVTVSMGVAAADFKSPTDLTPEQVVQSADKALYRAKKKGRNCIVAE
jgi:diguanylate cyclase (GGDEF)-like protein